MSKSNLEFPDTEVSTIPVNRMCGGNGEERDKNPSEQCAEPEKWIFGIKAFKVIRF